MYILLPHILCICWPNHLLAYYPAMIQLIHYTQQHIRLMRPHASNMNRGEHDQTDTEQFIGRKY